MDLAVVPSFILGSIFIWITLGSLVGLVVYFLDNSEKVPAFLVLSIGILGALGGGVINGTLFGTNPDFFLVSSSLFSTSGALFAVFWGKHLLQKVLKS